MELNFALNVAFYMREYQRINNISAHCITNSQYLYDMITKNTKLNVKVKSTYVISYDEKIKTVRCTNHLIISLNNKTVIDPSYDTYVQKDRRYFTNVKDLVTYGVEFKDRTTLKEFITKYLHFEKIANDMNKGIVQVSDMKYYHDQADHMEIIYKEKGDRMFYPTNQPTALTK